MPVSTIKKEGLGIFALTDGFEKEDGGRDGDVERVHAPQHGDADMGIGCLTPLVGESC